MLILALAIAAITAGAGQEQRPAEPVMAERPAASDQERLEELNSIWLKAYETRDRKALGSVLADDFIGLYGETALSRQEMLDRLATRPSTKVSWEKLRIHVSGDAALVTAISTITTTREGKETSARFNYVDVYSRRNGEWRAIAAHVTRLAE